MKRLFLLLAVALAALTSLAGCGEDSSSSSGPASLAPQGSPIYIEGIVRPTGELKSNTDAAAETIAGIGNLGDFVVEELESSARDDGEPFDFEREVEPWLGEKAGIFFERGDEDESNLIVESTDTEATQEFVDNQAAASKEPYREASYEGVDYKVGGEDEAAIGVIDDFLVATEGEGHFEDAVDASRGESLAGEEGFEQTIAMASEGSLADVYVDVGRLLEQGEVEINDQVAKGLEEAGIEPEEATAVASLVPGADQVEIDIRSDLSEVEARGGNAPELLGSLPGDSFAALAISGLGEQLKETIDNIDEEGIPGEIPPGQLKTGLKEAGIDVDSIVGSLRDAGAFAVGSGESSLGGALVLTTEGTRAQNAISNFGLLLRGAGVPGVTALTGKTSGFSIRDDELGDKPLVVAARDERIAIGYGLPATLRGLAVGSGETLSDNPAYDDAVASLGGTPIIGFADGAAALRLADSLVPASEGGFEEAKQYLESIRFLALGSTTDTDPATAKLIAGLK